MAEACLVRCVRYDGDVLSEVCSVLRPQYGTGASQGVLGRSGTYSVCGSNIRVKGVL